MNENEEKFACVSWSMQGVLVGIKMPYGASPLLYVNSEHPSIMSKKYVETKMKTKMGGTTKKMAKLLNEYQS